MFFLKSKVISTTILLGMLVSACSQEPRVQVVRLSDDVTKSILPEDIAKNIIQPVDPALSCEEHLKKITCLTKDPADSTSITCDVTAVTPEMHAVYSELLAQMPELQRKTLCHLSRIQLHTDLVSIGYASSMTSEQGEDLGHMIGVRLDVFMGTFKGEVFSWKEQLNFGMSKPQDPDYNLNPRGPRVEQSMPGARNLLLLYVMVHEMNHVIDFLNLANSADYQEPTPQNPAFVIDSHPNSFSRLSWPAKTTYTEQGSPEVSAMYPFLSQMCYYSCRQTLPSSMITPIYQELKESNFLTSYSASSFMEDFADALTIYALKDRGYEYRLLNDMNTVLFESKTQWEKDSLKSKREWLKDFMARPGLKYKLDSQQPNP